VVPSSVPNTHTLTPTQPTNAGVRSKHYFFTDCEDYGVYRCLCHDSRQIHWANCQFKREVDRRKVIEVGHTVLALVDVSTANNNGTTTWNRKFCTCLTRNGDICDSYPHVDSCRCRWFAIYIGAHVRHADIFSMQRSNETSYIEGLSDGFEGGIAVKAIPASARWRSVIHLDF